MLQFWRCNTATKVILKEEDSHLVYKTLKYVVSYKMKEELFSYSPTPLLIVPYEEPIDKELAYLKTISYRDNNKTVSIDLMILLVT